MVSFAYLRLLTFLLAILIPACASSSLTFRKVYSAFKLNKQGDNIQPWHTPLPIWNQSTVPCLVLTVASWPAYRFLRKQVRWSGIPISLRIFHILLWSTWSLYKSLYKLQSYNLIIHSGQRSWGRRLGIRKCGIEPQESTRMVYRGMDILGTPV